MLSRIYLHVFIALGLNIIMFLNNLHVCPFIITNIIAKITDMIFFSQLTFREISRLKMTDSLMT